jgi:hypothetical protein
MGDADSSLQVEDAANHGILRRLGHAQCNLISIFGAARQGKSFLMNNLAGQEDMFRISNAREPCTQGVDLCSHVMPLHSFAAIADKEDCSNASTLSSKSSNTMVGFVDAEGQGDRDVTYDARLITPVLLMSKVVIFNWKDSLQKDAILNLLGVMIMAAEGIKLGGQDESNGERDSGPKFEHLHIVFRDWNFIDVAEDEVYADLFEVEAEPPPGRKMHSTHGDGTGLRNKARADLLRTFSSIRVHLFPAPTASTADLATKIRFTMLTPRFRDKLSLLRASITAQLAEGAVRLGGAATSQSKEGGHLQGESKGEGGGEAG